MKYSNIDMHCDTLLFIFNDKTCETVYNGAGMQNIQYMVQGKQMAQFFAIFFPPKERPHNPDRPPRDLLKLKSGRIPVFPDLTDEDYYKAMRDGLYEVVRHHSSEIALAKTAEDIETNYKKGLPSVLLTIEDGRFVDGNMERLMELKKDGVIALGLTWNSKNCFGFPNSRDADTMSRGLTPFGKEAIGVMNDTGIIVDVSHLSDGGFFDVVNLTRKPFIASHSNCREITNHPRNLTDEMIRALAKKGGVAGLNFAPEFVTTDPQKLQTRVDDLVTHILHMIKVGGEDVVAFGTDFDGFCGDLEIDHCTRMDILYDRLAGNGVTASQLEKFASKNVLRVLRDTL